MSTLRHALEPIREPQFCTTITFRDSECGKDTRLECAYCSSPVCISCSDPCYSCGLHLHPECREDHEQDAKHPVDSPTWKAPKSAFDQAIDELQAIVARRV